MPFNKTVTANGRKVCMLRKGLWPRTGWEVSFLNVHQHYGSVFVVSHFLSITVSTSASKRQWARELMSGERKQHEESY